MSNVYISEPVTSGKVVLHTTIGDLDIELWPKEAPKACRNFVQLCMEGYYDNTIFHRLIPNFIVQGGDPTGTGTGGESIYGGPFQDEVHSRLRFTRRGLVAMANEGPNSNNSQFFITLCPTPELNGKYTIFGKVIGNTIYNLIKVNDFVVDGNDRPAHPPSVTAAEVLHSPFDDVLPRLQKAKKEEVKEERPAKKRKIGKNTKLLSFEEEEGGAEVAEKKMISFAQAKKKERGESIEPRPAITPSTAPSAPTKDDLKNKIRSIMKGGGSGDKEQNGEGKSGTGGSKQERNSEKTKREVDEGKGSSNSGKRKRDEDDDTHDDGTSSKSAVERTPRHRDEGEKNVLEDKRMEKDLDMSTLMAEMKKKKASAKENVPEVYKPRVRGKLVLKKNKGGTSEGGAAPDEMTLSYVQKYRHRSQKATRNEEQLMNRLTMFKQSLIYANVEESNEKTEKEKEKRKHEEAKEKEAAEKEPEGKIEGEEEDAAGWKTHKLKFTGVRDPFETDADDMYSVIDPRKEKGDRKHTGRGERGGEERRGGNGSRGRGSWRGDRERERDRNRR